MDHWTPRDMGSKNSNGSKLVVTKNSGRLSFLLFLLKNLTQLSRLVSYIFLILSTPLFTTATRHIHIGYLLLRIPYTSVMFHFWKGKNNLVFNFNHWNLSYI